LPSNYSLKGYCPTPKSQGQQPSCVGWASGYGARTIAYAIKNNWKNNTAKINQNTFSPSFIYNIIKGKNDNACQRGSYIESAMKLMNLYGVLKLSDFPYTDKSCKTGPSKYGLELAKKNKILTFERLAKWDHPYNLVGKVKKAIANKNPVVIGMQVSKTFYRVKGAWNGVQIGKPGGHAMVVIGYDDNKYGGAFEIMNSWGNNWGNNGFIWVPYSAFKKNVKTAFVLVDKEGSPNVDNDNNNNNNYSKKLAGTLTLMLSSGNHMPVALSNDANRGFNVVKATKTTYKVTRSYPSGTQFRIYLKSNQKGYVYLIGYGGADKSVDTLYPFDNYSPFFNYTDSEIAIPNEDYFIEFDNKPGRDILCVLYSKEKLDINTIIRKAKYGTGTFVSRIKKALQNKMFKGNDVKFNRNNIAFNATSNASNATVVPIFIAMNHQ